MIDAHRKYDLEISYFPSSEQLKRLEINRVIYILEAPLQKFSSLPSIRDLGVLLEEYQINGFKIESYGIDIRDRVGMDSLHLYNFVKDRN